MSLTPEQKQIRKQEAQIGKKASELATRYLHSTIKGSLEIKNEGGFFKGKREQPILQASRVKSKMGRYKLLGLNLTSNRYGFIHHYGFEGERTSSFVKLAHSRFELEFTNRRSHALELSDQPLFEDIYFKSGAVTYLQKELSVTRTADFQAKFNAFVAKLSPDDE